MARASVLRIFPFTPRVRAVPKFPSLATFQAFCSRLKSVVNNVKSKYFRQSHRIMDSDNESCHSESEFYYPDEDFGKFRAFHSDPIDKNNTLFAGTGRSVLGKTESPVSSMAHARVFCHRLS